MGVATYIKDEKDAIKKVILQSGIEVKPVYTPQDLQAVGFEYKQDLGAPGEYPFTIPWAIGAGTGRPDSTRVSALPRKPTRGSNS